MEQVSVLTSSQTEQLVRWFDDLWWTGGRTRTDVEQMLRHSTIVAFADRDGGLAAFARVLSDRVYKALVLDVVVAEEQRGRGVGATLMDAVLAHPAVASCQHVELYCAPDLIAFYQGYGFTSEVGTLAFMRRTGSR